MPLSYAFSAAAIAAPFLLSLTYHQLCMTSGFLGTYYIRYYSSSETDSPNSEKPLQQQHRQCKLYLAESSIPNAGMGVYTAVDVHKGSSIGNIDPIIPITDAKAKTNWTIGEFHWNSDDFEGIWYESDRSLSALIPGFGALVNCHFGLNNFHHKHQPMYDSAGLHRYKDPGAGAFTYWHGVDNVAKRDIMAGEELFISYGESYFTGKKRKEKMGPIPNATDFEEADQIVAKAHQQLNIEETADDSKETKEAAWKNIVASEATSDRVRMVLPKHYDELEEAHKVGTARHSLGRDSIKTQGWLNENGICLDTVYVKESTLPQAGRGAFAKEHIPRGSVIVPVPVMPVNRTNLIVRKHKGKTTSLQLLTNYVYGHPESEIVLLPYSSEAVYVNHGGKVRANAKLSWTTSSTPIHKDELFGMKPHEIIEGVKLGLLMEFIATRDISPDEEILIDYGDEWDWAWTNHVKDWKPIQGSSSYVQSNILTKELNGYYKTKDEQKEEPYHSSVSTAVKFWLKDLDFYDVIISNDEERGEHTVYHANWTQDLDKDSYCIRQCEILHRSLTTTDGNATYAYDVKILPYRGKILPSACVWDEDDTIYIDKVPSEAISMIEKSYESDQHLLNAFRHEIGLPDDLLPAAWRRTY